MDRSGIVGGSAALLATCAVTTAAAQTPIASLAEPPANATHYVIESTGGKHGDSYVWTAPDGSLMGRESMNLRGQVWETDMAGRAVAGVPVSMTIRGVTPSGDAGETFATAGGDPSTTIGDLRHTRLVMLDGKLLDADALRSAAGYSGRPKFAGPD